MAAPIKSLEKLRTPPEQGKWYRLLSDFGEGVGMLTKTHYYKDQQQIRMLRVLDIVEPATYGVGYSSEQTVLCMWLESPAPGRLVQHNISFPISQFIALFGVGEEPPEYVDWQAENSSGGE